MDMKKFFDIFFHELSEKLGVEIDDIKIHIEESGQIFSESLAKKLGVPFTELERVAFRLLHEEGDKYCSLNDIETKSFECPCHDLHYEIKILMQNGVGTKLHNGPFFCPTCGAKIENVNHPDESYKTWPNG